MFATNRPKIFITHSWRDIEFSRRIYDDLSKQGFEVWLDDRAVQAGERFAGAIDRGLEWCDVYIPVLSYASLASPWCREEIEAAVSLSNEQGRNGRPRIIPLLLENCQDQMPALLRARLYINFSTGYEAAFKELLAKGFGSSHPASRGGQSYRSQAGQPAPAAPRAYTPEASTQAQCPKCGNYKTKIARYYVNRSTGKPTKVMDNPVINTLVLIISSLPGALIFTSMLELGTEMFFLIAFITFIIFYSISETERRKMIAGKSKRVITKYNYDCKNCGYHWEV